MIKMDYEENNNRVEVNATSKTYELHKIYGEEKPLARYKRITVGEGVGNWTLLKHELVLGLCTGLPGLPGLAMRSWLYPRMFNGIESGAYLGKHVSLRCPRQVCIAKGVIVDDYVQIVATSRHPNAISIGKNSVLRSFAMVNAGPPEGYVHIGEDSGIGQGTILYGNGGLKIGNKVIIAGQCFIVASSHNFDNPDLPIADQGYSARGIQIEDNVWIGAGAKILDGVTIGTGAIVGANAVVTRSVAPGDRVAGVPARSLVFATTDADTR
jgi:acetyltransferase-like isoleucine patch superfamily enzyme